MIVSSGHKSMLARDRARTVKAAKLVGWIDANISEASFSHLADLLEGMSADWWAERAELAGVNRPSGHVIDMVIGVYRERAARKPVADPFAGINGGAA